MGFIRSSFCTDRLVIPDVNKNYVIQGADYLGKNDITQGQVNSTDMLPNKIVKQSRVTNLTLYKHWLGLVNLASFIHFTKKLKLIKQHSCSSFSSPIVFL